MTEQTPSKRRYQKTRQGILDAASQLIMEQGVEALSMRALAEKVDYSASALYKYFDNKEEIISALREEGHRLSDEISRSRVKPGMDIRETMTQMGLGYLEFARRYPAHYQLIMNPTDDVPANFDEFINDPGFTGLIGFSTRAVESGQMHLPEGSQPVHLAFLMWFVGHGAAMIQNTVMKNCPQEISVISEQVIRMLANMV
jgi:AcrR family transcriptional regulator